MGGFTKLFSTIVTSTVWMENDEVLRVWIALLSQSDAAGNVEGSVPGFAHLCRMGVEQFQAAIGRLETPDPFSRTPDNAGRRIETVSGGWRILNYMKYREARNEDARRKQNAEAQKRWRDAHKPNSKQISQSKPSVIHGKPASAHAEAEAEAEAKKGGPNGSAPLPDSEFLQALRENKAYDGIDIDRERGKAESWCLANRRMCSKRFFVNWLNKAERPLGMVTASRPPTIIPEPANWREAFREHYPNSPEWQDPTPWEKKTETKRREVLGALDRIHRGAA
jgi:hypothetical protein